MEHRSGCQGRIYPNLAFHPKLMEQVGDSTVHYFLRETFYHFLGQKCLKQGFTDRTYKTIERNTVFAKKAGLDILVRQHDDISGTPARGLAEAARASFHNNNCMLCWNVWNMELNFVCGKHAGHYHMSSHLNRGVLNMVEPIAHGYQYINDRWKPTHRKAAILHE